MDLEKTFQMLNWDGPITWFYALSGLEHPAISRLPRTLKVLLEDLVRRNEIEAVRAVLEYHATKGPHRPEVSYLPARILLQDFTGVPLVVDLASLRDALKAMGGDPSRVEPVIPVTLVIDHSVQVDRFASRDALATNVKLEYERNKERYALLKWAQQAFKGFRVVPPGFGICHQVNLEFLATVVSTCPGPDGKMLARPDTLLGTDSHTPMVNGIGVLGWGVGGIEAEAAMLGFPLFMTWPEVVGVKLVGKLRPHVSATDLVLTITEKLRKVGVVGSFVEFFGPGLDHLPVPDRATVANMAPEYGATVGYFPVDRETLEYLRFTGRSEEHIRLVETYAKAQGLFREDVEETLDYDRVVEVVLDEIEPSVAGPRRPQDRMPLSAVAKSFAENWPDRHRKAKIFLGEKEVTLADGAVVIAAITSCTNTSNPTVMVAAGLLAKKAVERGLRSAPWVKTSLAPGSRVVTQYLERCGLLPYLEALGFHVVGYGCTTCIGNSGALPEPVAKGIEEEGLVVAAVLSGNRNFEGRIHPQVRANYLMAPPLVVAYAIAGSVTVDLSSEPLGLDKAGNPVFLADIWPTLTEVQDFIRASLRPEMFRTSYAKIFEGDVTWASLPAPAGLTYAWDPTSTYIKKAPFFEAVPKEPQPLQPIRGLRVLVMLGDSVTTDHISPAGAIRANSPAAKYLLEKGVDYKDFNTYGARRGNHEVMVRGTFANIRLRNLLVPGVEGGYTRLTEASEPITVFEAALRYAEQGVPLMVIAGSEYGTGSSRDWAAKGTALLGIRAVLAKSFERIHRSNLVGMGVLPLQFEDGQDAQVLGLSGFETYDVEGLHDGLSPRPLLTVKATRQDGSKIEFRARARLETPQEVEILRHGGILPFVLRSLLG